MNAQLITDPRYREILTRILRQSRKGRIYNRLKRSGQLTPDYFLSNIQDVWEKKSVLPAEIRQVIDLVCAKAMIKYLETKQEDKQ